MFINSRDTSKIDCFNIFSNNSLQNKITTNNIIGDIIPILDNGGIVGVNNSAYNILCKLYDECNLYKFHKQHNKTITLDNIEHNKTIDEITSFLGEDKNLILKILEDSSKFYQTFRIPKKSGGFRKIEAPSKELKKIQNKILKEILYRFKPSDMAYGFIKKRNIIQNAEKHKGKKYLLKIDLKNFFPNITRKQILGALIPIITKENVSIVINLIELCLLHGRLPQGSPCSPALSNIVMQLVDYSIYGLCRFYNITYTRYADDLCFSSNSDFKKYIPIIKTNIVRFGFTINKTKVGYFKQGRRMTVTGIITNNKDFLSVPRNKRMRLRAKLHNIITNKIPFSKDLIPQLKGEINFVKMVNKQQGEKLEKQFDVIIQKYID